MPDATRSQAGRACFASPEIVWIPRLAPAMELPVHRSSIETGQNRPGPVRMNRSWVKAPGGRHTGQWWGFKAMARIVLKFGGTSVGDVDRIKNVARKVKAEVDAGHQ